VLFNMRTALEPAEVAGEHIEEGQGVIVLQGAANRDPDRFPDPDALDLARPDNVPMSFGWGAHHCIGAALAKMEGEIVLRAWATKTSSIDLLDDAPPWKPGLTLHGLERLPLSLTPA
jgi:cytochrome P450